MPPPTVKGTNRSFAARRTVSTRVLRASDVAVISSSTSSSAPAEACASANSAGSPASRSCWNCMPLTTRPAATSRQAMMRLAKHEVSDILGFGVLGWSGSEGTEILQNFQSGFGGFLRMKLHTEDIVPLDSGRKTSAIICASRSLVDYRRAVGVGVIDKRAAVHTLQQARTRANFQLVPAHMRRLY